MRIYKITISLFWLSLTISHVNPAQDVTPLKIGNLALPTSQQPGALFGFGQNGVDKGNVQLFGLFLQPKIKHENSMDVSPGAIYGITDDLSLLLTAPIRVYQKNASNKPIGIQSIFTQLEYAFYKKSQLKSTDTATLVGSIIFPTQKTHALSFFLGPTISKTTTEWYLFASPGALLTTTRNSAKEGNQYFFQCGLGKNIPSSPKFIAMWMIELNGIYTSHDKNQHITDHDSGGLAIYLGPTFWQSSNRIIVQGGILFPIYQKLNGTQNKHTYLAALNVGVTL